MHGPLNSIALFASEIAMQPPARGVVPGLADLTPSSFSVPQAPPTSSAPSAPIRRSSVFLVLPLSPCRRSSILPRLAGLLLHDRRLLLLLLLLRQNRLLLLLLLRQHLLLLQLLLFRGEGSLRLLDLLLL